MRERDDEMKEKQERVDEREVRKKRWMNGREGKGRDNEDRMKGTKEKM